MRKIIVKFDGQCARCGKTLSEGDAAMYEKSMGIFCPGCEPIEIEEIRAFRFAKAERKAARYDDWAEKREAKAHMDLNSHPELRHDWAFITQPGHIPFRARMNAADQRAIESLDKAKEMRSKAAGLRCVRVAGDAERKRQALREKLDTVINKGSRVIDAVFGPGTVKGVYAKSYRIAFDSGFTHSRDKSYVRPLISD
jgi:hypothetical protein